MFKVLTVVFAIFATVSHGQLISTGTCATPKYKSFLDLNAYLGGWGVAYKYPDDNICEYIYFDYEPISMNASIDLYRYNSLGNDTSIYYLGKLPCTYFGLFEHVNSFGLDEVTDSFHYVLDTDYLTYSINYYCTQQPSNTANKMEWVYLLGTPNSTQLTTMEALLQSNGISTAELVQATQTCWGN